MGLAKKKLVYCEADKRSLIETDNSEISLRRQCELLGLNRSNLYYRSRAESAEDLLFKRLLDEQYTGNRFTG